MLIAYVAKVALDKNLNKVNKMRVVIARLSSTKINPYQTIHSRHTITYLSLYVGWGRTNKLDSTQNYTLLILTTKHSTSIFKQKKLGGSSVSILTIRMKWLIATENNVKDSGAHTPVL